MCRILPGKGPLLVPAACVALQLWNVGFRTALARRALSMITVTVRALWACGGRWDARTLGTRFTCIFLHLSFYTRGFRVPYVYVFSTLPSLQLNCRVHVHRYCDRSANLGMRL